MNNINTDRRVRKTKKLLRQTLTKLLLEKDINKISVIELTQLADINRGTFYLHYKDIYDLYEQLENEMIEEFKTIFQRHYQQSSREGLLPVVSETFEFLAQNADMCIVALKTGDSAFLTKFIELGKPKSLEEWQSLLGNIDPKLYEYYYSFITYGCVGLLRTWFFEGMKESPKIMAKLTEQMIKNMMK
ncbi:MAG: TetR/AcrR family transcriptional regulator [Anaerovoracaceae bacterium]